MQKQADLAKFLKSKRTALGLSQKKVAERLGYTTPQFVSNWERGVSFPPVKTLKKLGEYYKVPSDEIFAVMLNSTVQRLTVDMRKRFYGKKSI